MSPLVIHTLDEVARHTGLAFRDTRLVAAVEIIQAWLARHAIANPSEIGPGIALDALLEQLVVHESYFDRDVEQLRLVDELVLARLVDTTDQIRLWSAGCANGEEAYTLAFMLASRGLLERATITATDLSAAAVARARAGTYRPWSVRTATDSPAMRYLVRANGQLHVPDAIKRAIRFEILNLVEDPFPADQHLIVCRNVLIYLDPPAIATVATKLANALAPDGWLFVAPSDARLDPFAPLVATVTDRGVYYRRGDAVAPIRAVPAPLPPAIARLTAARLPPKPLPPPPSLSTAMRVRALADRGDHAAARALLAEALVATPLDAELHFLEAVLAADEDVKASLAALDRASYLAPDAPVTYLFAGRMQQARGDARAARRAYERALHLLESLAPDAPVPWSDEPAWIIADACREALASS